MDFNYIRIKIQQFSYRKTNLSPTEWWPLCIDLNVLHKKRLFCANAHSGGYAHPDTIPMTVYGLGLEMQDYRCGEDSRSAHWFLYYSHWNRMASVWKTTNVAQSSGCPLIPIWYHPSKGRSRIYAEPELGRQFAGSLTVPGTGRMPAKPAKNCLKCTHVNSMVLMPLPNLKCPSLLLNWHAKNCWLYSANRVVLRELRRWHFRLFDMR